jgi:hypothetical protein
VDRSQDGHLPKGRQSTRLLGLTWVLTSTTTGSGSIVRTAALTFCMSQSPIHGPTNKSSAPMVKDRSGEPERGGSEWEPIKILFKNSAYEPNFTHAPPHASLAKSTQPLECYWT